MNKQFNNQPLVSIIMNCHNGEAYLWESIKSVLSQTYENWELIFWDNQSSDSSKKIFECQILVFRGIPCSETSSKTDTWARWHLGSPHGGVWR